MGKGCCVGRSRRREVKSVKSSQVTMDGCMARVPRRRGAARARRRRRRRREAGYNFTGSGTGIKRCEHKS